MHSFLECSFLELSFLNAFLSYKLCFFFHLSTRLADIVGKAQSLHRLTSDSGVKRDAEEMRVRVSALKTRVEQLVSDVSVRIDHHLEFLR